MIKTIQNRILSYLKTNFYNLFLKINAIGIRNRRHKSSRIMNYGRALQALLRYPLNDSNVQQHLRVLENPQALKTQQQVEEHYTAASELGLPLHKGVEKNWDFLAAFSQIFQRANRKDVILDLGSGPSSVILNWLHLYGYKNLYGCDLLIENARSGHIEYRHENIQNTHYPDNFADVITCLSVVEHGVDSKALFQECQRLLKPNGLLIISTDFWCESHDLTDVFDELGPVTIFTPQTLQQEYFEIAADCGFQVMGEPQFDCQELVVNRPNVPAIHKRYTFYYMAFAYSPL